MRIIDPFATTGEQAVNIVDPFEAKPPAASNTTGLNIVDPFEQKTAKPETAPPAVEVQPPVAETPVAAEPVSAPAAQNQAQPPVVEQAPTAQEAQTQAQTFQEYPPYEPAPATGLMARLKGAGFGAVPENPDQYIPQAYKGIMSGAAGLGSIWEGVNIGADASALGIAAKQLSNFDAIDAGTLKDTKQFLGKPSSQTWIDNAQYMNGDEATRAAIREKYAGAISERKDFIQSSLATIEQYKKFAKQHKGKVEDFTSIQGVQDFTDWLKFNMGSAGVQLAPIILAAVATGGTGAALVGVGMSSGEQFGNRIEYVLNQKDIKALPPEQQASAVEKYIQDTMGVSMAVASASGALDAVTGPVGAILRAKFAKEAAKAAGKEIAGDVAVKQAVKEIPRSVIEESLTGLTQEAFSILGEKYLGEQNLDFLDPKNRNRLINAMASEGVGGLVGGGFNVGAAAKRYQTASPETQARLGQLGQALLSSVEGVEFTKAGIDEEARNQLRGTAPLTMEDLAGPAPEIKTTGQEASEFDEYGYFDLPEYEELSKKREAAGERLTALHDKTDSLPEGSDERTEASIAASKFFDDVFQPLSKQMEAVRQAYAAQAPTPVAEPTAVPQEEMVTSTAPGISVSYPKERAEPTFTIDPETGEVIPPTRVEPTMGKDVTPDVEKQIETEATRYAREYNVPLDLATAVIRGQHARGDLDVKRPLAKSDTGRTEPSISVSEQGAAATQGVAPSDTTGLAGPVEGTEPSVTGEGTELAPLTEIPTLTERPPAATYAQLHPDDKVEVLQEAQNLWQSGEANLPMAKAWNSLPSWKRDMFAEEVYANYDEITTNSEALRAAVDKVAGTTKPTEAKVEAPVAETPVEVVEPEVPVETPAAPIEQAQTKLAEAETAVTEATTPEEKQEATKQRNVARQELKKAQIETPATTTTEAAKPKRGRPAKPKVEGAAPVAPKPKGRRKIERTPEEQVAYEEGRNKIRAEINKARRAVEGAIAKLEEKIDVDKFDTPAALETATDVLRQERAQAVYTLSTIATNPMFRSVASSGVKAKQFLASDAVTLQERANIAERLKLEEARNNRKAQAAPDSRFTKLSPSGVGKKTNRALYKFSTAAQAAAYIAKTGTVFERALARRLLPFLNNVNLVIADTQEDTIDSAKNVLGNDTAAYFADTLFGEPFKMIVLRGENYGGTAAHGVNNVTFLHEALHAALAAKIDQAMRLVKAGKVKDIPANLKALVNDLYGIMNRAQDNYDALKASGKPISKQLQSLFEGIGIGANIDEFISYGLTDAELQKFLLDTPALAKRDRSIIDSVKNLFTKFVETLRRAFDLGANHQSAFQDLILATEGLLMEQENDPAEAEEIRLAAKNLKNKITKADKDIEKVQQSHNLSGGVELFKKAGDLRTFKNYETLIKSSWDSMAVNSKLYMLGAFPTSSIIDWKGDQVPALKRIDELVQRAAGLRQNLLAGYARKADALGRFVSREGENGSDKLATAMHLARLSNVTPSVYADRADALANDPRVVRFKKLLADPSTNPDELNAISDKLNERIASINATFDAYDALKPIKGAQDMYKMVRQVYKDSGALIRTLLDQNIDKLQLEGDVNDPSTPKGRLMLSVRRMYEDSDFKGVEEYFPFMRHGDQRLDVAGPSGKETYFFDTKKERKKAIAERAEQLGANPKDGNIFTVSDESHRDSRNIAAKESRMLTEMFRIIDDAAAKPGVNKEDLKDQLYQVYLSTLPEASYRKQFIHAENVTGFSKDIFRNFQVATTRIANQATKIRYGQEVENEIQAANDTTAGMPPDMQEELKGFVNEIAIRAREEFDPRPQSRIANGLTQFAYYWLLSGAASAAIQTTALPIFVMSHLNPEYGYGKSAAKLAKWMNVYNSMGFTAENYEGERTLTAPTVRESSLFDKNPILQRAFDEALARNVVNQLSGTPYSDSNRTPTNARNSASRVVLRETANLMSGLFTGAERLTREVAYMMTFELEYEKSKDFDKAVQKAVDMVHNQLGRFDTFDKPRLLRNGIGKVALQFKPYAAVVTKIFIKGYLAATTPGKRSEGLQILTGILLTGAMLHGVTGMPLYTVICNVIDAVLDDLEDDEKRKRKIARYRQVYGEDSIPDDWGIDFVRNKEERIAYDPLTATSSDLRFRYEFLPRTTGGLNFTTDSGRVMELSQMLEKGPVSVATDMNIGSRTSFNEIWFKSPREGKDLEEQIKNYAEALTPASISAVMNVVKGVSGIIKGDTRKGIEQASPAALANPLKAERVASEGVTTKENELILGKSELSTANIIAQATGLTSTRAAALEEMKYKFKGEKLKADKQKLAIIADLKKAFVNDSIPQKEQDEAQDKVFKRIEQFNSRYPVPGLIIDGDTIAESINNELQARGMSSRGMRINDAVMPRIREMRERMVPGQPK
jgi:hypothetical protein